VPAFGPGYRGPLAVAACDLNGDGVPDLVAAGRGLAGPEVRTLDGVTGQPIGPGPLAMAGLAGAGVGGRDPLRRTDHLFLDVGCADVDADGVPDLIVGSAPQAGQAVVRVLSGASGTAILEIPIPVDLPGGVAVGP
jgi:hypothetical protein